MLQNCFISFKLLPQDLKFDTVYDNVVALQKIAVYMKFPKEVPVIGINGTFYPNFAPQQQHHRHAFFKKRNCI